jgi:hypothetical protein
VSQRDYAHAVGDHDTKRRMADRIMVIDAIMGDELWGERER